MKSLYVMGPPGSGKTATCVGIALKCRDEGLKVAYFKPVAGPPAHEDEDAALMRAVLGMDVEPEAMVLFTAGPYYLSRYEPPGEFAARVMDAFGRLSSGADVVLVGGAPWPEAMASLGLDAASVAAALGARVLIVHGVEDDRSADAVVLYSEWVRARGAGLLGAILNNVPRALIDKAKGVYAPYIAERGCPVLGIVPVRAEVAAPTVREFYEVLGGEVIAGEEGMDRIVEDVLVGAMTLDVALSYFRRAPNKVVVTGGDRADIALAALETSTAALVLTGGLYPSVNVVARAADMGVPVILVHHDTYSAIEMLRQVSRKIKPNDKRGISMARENVERYCDLPAILAALR